MNITLPLQSMTTAEKLEMMEAIWADLCRDERLVESPAWHEQVLRERDAEVREAVEAVTAELALVAVPAPNTFEAVTVKV